MHVVYKQYAVNALTIEYTQIVVPMSSDILFMYSIILNHASMYLTFDAPSFVINFTINDYAHSD